MKSPTDHRHPRHKLFAAVGHLVGGRCFRDWLLSDAADEQSLRALPRLTPEMAAAVSKIMRVQDLVLVAQKIRVYQPVSRDHGPARALIHTPATPTIPPDEPAGIAASILDARLFGNGDA